MFLNSATKVNSYLVRATFPVPFVDTSYSVTHLSERNVAYADRVSLKKTSSVEIAENEAGGVTTHSVIAIGKWK